MNGNSIVYNLPGECDKISLARVEFRTTKGYDGSFGFDWLRIDDQGLEKQGHYSLEKPYKNIIKGGYGNGLTDLTPEEAYKKLENEYHKIAVAMPIRNPYLREQYYVPYLTLYPKTYVDTLRGPAYTKPKYIAELRVLVEITEDIDSLEFGYNTNIFNIDKPKLQDKTKTNGLQLSADKTVTITCKKEITIDRDGEIYVYAYPKAAAGKSIFVREAMRRVAGKIKVLKNTVTQRKKQKFVLVSVITNVSGTEKRGKFKPKGAVGEVFNTRRVLHQMLVETEFVHYRKDKNGNRVKITLDLSGDSKFKMNGDYVDEDGNIDVDALIDGVGDVTAYLRKAFFQDANNNIFRDYFTVFVIDVKTYDGTIGQALKIGVKSLALFPERDSETMAHEGLHGLGLYHTHRDDDDPPCSISEGNQKYIYEHAYTNASNATDNIMSYNNLCKTTWHWQWNIVRRNIFLYIKS